MSGGWLPLLVATVLFTIMTTWQSGRRAVRRRRTQIEGSLDDFLDQITSDPHVRRVPGTAVFPHPTNETVPLALRVNVERNHVLHEHIIIVTAESRPQPHVGAGDRLHVQDLAPDSAGVHYVSVRYGFSDRLVLPAALHQAQTQGQLESKIDVEGAVYFVSRATLRTGAQLLRPRWRARLFTALAHNAADPAEVLGIPLAQTVVLGAIVEI